MLNYANAGRFEESENRLQVWDKFLSHLYCLRARRMEISAITELACAWRKVKPVYPVTTFSNAVERCPDDLKPLAVQHRPVEDDDLCLRLNLAKMVEKLVILRLKQLGLEEFKRCVVCAEIYTYDIRSERIMIPFVIGSIE